MSTLEPPFSSSPWPLEAFSLASSSARRKSGAGLQAWLSCTIEIGAVPLVFMASSNASTTAFVLSSSVTESSTAADRASTTATTMLHFLQRWSR